MSAQTKRTHGCEIIAGKAGFLNCPKSGEGEDPVLVNCEDQFASCGLIDQGPVAQAAGPHLFPTLTG